MERLSSFVLFKVPFFSLAFFSVGLQGFSRETLKPESAGVRQHLIDKAEVWAPINTSELDLRAGPPSRFRTYQKIDCTFIEPDRNDPPGGNTDKFECRDESGKKVKVKYGHYNAEVVTEVAASRLLWALGFGADRYYPALVHCRNCPREPWTYIKDYLNGDFQRGAYGDDAYEKEQKWARGDYDFSAIVEDKFEGAVIEEFKGQGWGFREILNFSQLPRQQQIYREGLMTMMAFLQNPDNKAVNQRFHCLDKTATSAETCQRPFLVVHDLGWTFGHGWRSGDLHTLSRMNLSHWKRVKVFSNLKECRVRAHNSPKIFFIPLDTGGTWQDIDISEDGRKFIVGQLKKLNRTQITALFQVSGVDSTSPKLQGGEENRNIASWVAAFEAKVAELDQASCPPLPRLR